MSIVLASAARLEGYLNPFSQIHPWLLEHYDHIHLACPTGTDPALAETFRTLPKVEVSIAKPEQTSWRHLTLRKSLEFPCTHIHYADYDHIIRWFKDYPQEVKRTLAELQQTDCLIVGRTQQAMSSYARALVETEGIVNLVLSHLLGQQVDLCAGVRGFSRRAAEFLMRHSPPNHHPIGSDAEWPVLLWRGEFELRMTWVDGLSWEHHVVGGETPEQARANYDAQIESWQNRTRLAREIIEAGFQALNRPLSDSA